MKARLPNLITSFRFLLALVFFVALEFYEQGRSAVWILDVAFTLFVITAVTDILDGYLARRWKQESTFGRIVDPLVDKVLVIGAFLYLASDHFATFVAPTVHVQVEGGLAVQAAGGHLVNASGVAGWMVVLVLIRELLVTGLRGFSEAQGLSFKATIPGKIKMFVQCWAAGTAMVVAGHFYASKTPWAMHLRDISLWAMVAVTLFSMLVYVERARQLLGRAMKGPAGESPKVGPS